MGKLIMFKLTRGDLRVLNAVFLFISYLWSAVHFFDTTFATGSPFRYYVYILIFIAPFLWYIISASSVAVESFIMDNRKKEFTISAILFFVSFVMVVCNSCFMKTNDIYIELVLGTFLILSFGSFAYFFDLRRVGSCPPCPRPGSVSKNRSGKSDAKQENRSSRLDISRFSE